MSRGDVQETLPEGNSQVGDIQGPETVDNALPEIVEVNPVGDILPQPSLSIMTTIPSSNQVNSTTKSNFMTSLPRIVIISCLSILIIAILYTSKRFWKSSRNIKNKKSHPIEFWLRGDVEIGKK